MGLRTIAVHSEADASLPFVREADEAVLLGPPPPAESYLVIDKLIEAARRTGAEAIHPGYGFLAESGIRSSGHGRRHRLGRAAAGGDRRDGRQDQRPQPDGRRRSAGRAGTREPVADVDAALAAAREIGYPLMVKASAGGGGIGMGVAYDDGGSAPRSRPRAPGRSGSSARRRSCSSATSRGRVTSRSRCSVWEAVACGRARRARLLGAATASEGGRGDAVARRLRRASTPHDDGRGARRRGGRLPQRGHRRVPGRPDRRRTTSSSR